MEGSMLKGINPEIVLSKAEYKKVYDELALRIGELQRTLRKENIPMMVIFEGIDGAGKGTLINNLLIPMDSRGVKVEQTLSPEREEKLHSFLWPFWNKIPAKGRVVFWDKSWYSRIGGMRLQKVIGKKSFEEYLVETAQFERELEDDGMIIIKFFLHISKDEQKKRFKKLEKNSATSWRVTKDDWREHSLYKKYIEIYSDILESKNGSSSWTIIEAADERYATIKMFQTLIKRIEEHINLAGHAAQMPKDAEFSDPVESVLAHVNLSLKLEKEEYKETLKNLQKKIRDIEHEMFSQRVGAVVLYEGWDAAGKGGNIRRVVEEMDPRGYQVVPVSAPNEIEKQYHYLWRFWKYFPKAGHLTIFDRSWYGRVLVERVEGFCSKQDWQRAYSEINDMERHLTNFGTAVVKFWLEVSKDEQMRRFKEREELAYKRWKITDEDYRNREKWDQYREAADEMLYRTNTTYAPWTVVESENKYYARVKALKTIIRAVEERLS